MNHFINFDSNTGLSINTFREPNSYANSDITGLVDDILAARHGSSCPLEGAKDALEDGSLWMGCDSEQELLVEELHELISRWEDGGQDAE